MSSKKTVVPIYSAPLTCGVCRFRAENFRGSGSSVCHALPPQVFPIDDDAAVSNRPIVRPEDPACTLHKPVLNS